jgi:hypothetical protein
VAVNATFFTPDFYRSISAAINLQLDAVDYVHRAMAPALEAQRSLLAGALQVHSQAALIGDALNRSLLPQLESMQLLSHEISKLVNPTLEAIGRSLTQIDWSTLVERIANLMPPNWPDDVQYEVAMQIVNDEGIPLVWVPRAELVTTLVEAPGYQVRIAILLENSDILVEDIGLCLEEVRGISELAGHLKLAEDALAAFADGHLSAAQALATDVLDSIVLAYIGRHADVHKKVLPVADDTELSEFVFAASLSPLVRAYEPFRADKGDAIPAAYNRHATVHGGSTIQFSPVNSLLSLLIVASVLRTIGVHEVERKAA